LAGARQANLSPDTEELYTKALLGYDIRHVAEAIKEFGTSPREAYQPAFPDLGSLISRVEAIRDHSRRRGKFVACESNGCKGGYLISADARYSYAAECDCLRRWRGGDQANVPDPMEEHLAMVQAYPERFVPVDACIQLGKALAMARTQRAGGSNPMREDEYRALKKKLTREMNEKWLAQLADRKTVAAGA
jgi:hypothetical protein